MMSKTLAAPTVFIFVCLCSIQALPSNTISSRQFTNPTPANLTDLSCFPAEPNTSLPPIPERNCLAALQAFVSEHNKTLNGGITFTTNRSLYSDPSPTNPFVATPTELIPATEPMEPDNATLSCVLVYAVYYDSAPIDQRPEANTTLATLNQATGRVIEHCTDANPRFAGNGGSVVLTNEEGQQIDITVQRPV